MDIQREIHTLMASGLQFSIEVSGGAVLLWVGDYLLHGTASATVASLDQAVEWLQQHVQLVTASET